jgi:LEA14-like dessication related protein
MKYLTTLLFAVILSGCAALQDSIEAPHVTLTDLRMLDMTLFEQRYGLKIRVQNPNPVELPITGMNFRLDVNDSELGRGVSDQSVTVPAYGEVVVEIKLTSNLVRIFDQIRALESGKGQSLRYHLSGGMSLANRISKLPFDYQGEFGQRR